MNRIYIVIIALIVALIMVNTTNAQDIIVLRNGAAVEAKVQEITSSEIKYRKFSNLNGPLYIVKKSEIFAINYENGEIENFTTQKEKAIFVEQSPEIAATNSQPTIITKPGDINNATLISTFNRNIEPVKSQKVNKREIWYKSQYVSYGITNNSTISNEDIEVSFERTAFPDPYYNTFFAYNIKVKNKTSETIYIDLEKSTRTETDGSYRVYYDPSKITTTTTGTGSAGAVHLGLVSIGEENYGSSSTTYSHNTQIILPAKSIGYFSKHRVECLYIQNYIWQPRSKYKTISEGEFLANEKISTVAHIGEVITFTEENTPYKLNYKISYTKGNNKKELYTVEFTLYVHQLFGYLKWKHIFGTVDDQNSLIIMKCYRYAQSSEDIPSIRATEY